MDTLTTYKLTKRIYALYMHLISRLTVGQLESQGELEVLHHRGELALVWQCVADKRRNLRVQAS